MKLAEKQALLQELTEDELRELVLLDLFKKMAYTRIYNYHGALEGGKDIVFCQDDPINNQIYISVVIKSHKITGDFGSLKGAKNILFQIQKSLKSPYQDTASGVEFPISKCYVVTPFEMDNFAINSFKEELKEFSTLVSFIDGPKLIELIDKYIPEIFEGKLFSQDKYIRNLYNNNHLVKNLKILGSLEDRKLYEIYTGGNLVDFGISYEMFPYLKNELKIFELLKEHNIIAIFGSPGAGKTLFLQKLILDLISTREGKLLNKITKIPIYLRLYSLTYSDVENENKFLKMLWSKLEVLGLKKTKIFNKNYEIIFLFDGYDEISSDQIRGEFIRCFINLQRQRYKNFRFIITSRYNYELTDTRIKYDEPLTKIKRVSLLSFNSDKRRDFIQKWFRGDFKETEILNSIIEKNRSLRHFSRTPLLLTMITIIYESSPVDSKQYFKYLVL